MVVTEAPKLAMPSSFCCFSNLPKRLSNLEKGPRVRRVSLRPPGRSACWVVRLLGGPPPGRSASWEVRLENPLLVGVGRGEGQPRP